MSLLLELREHHEDRREKDWRHESGWRTSVEHGPLNKTEQCSYRLRRDWTNKQGPSKFCSISSTYWLWLLDWCFDQTPNSGSWWVFVSFSYSWCYCILLCSVWLLSLGDLWWKTESSWIWWSREIREIWEEWTEGKLWLEGTAWEKNLFSIENRKRKKNIATDTKEIQRSLKMYFKTCTPKNFERLKAMVYFR